MESQNVLVALDVGTTKVCTLIAAETKDGFSILGIGSHPSHGLKKGSVVNIEKTVQSIRASIEEAKLMAGIEDLNEATVGIAGNHIFCFNSSGVVPVKGKEITEADVERVLEAAKAVLIPSDREVLHVIPQEFKVDNTSGIKDPVGMCGSRLEVYVHIVTGKTPLIQNLIKCVDHAGLRASQVILQPIASSRSVLTMEEKELGVALIDIGGGTTDLAVWKDGALIHSQIIPIGGNHFTNDLAVALKIPHNESERIKIQQGIVISEQADPKVHVSVQGLTGTRPKEVPLRAVAEVLEARADELFQVIKDIIAEKNLSSLITGGYVITGGGSMLRGLAELAEYTLERPAKIGLPRPVGGIGHVMSDPKFSTVLGLLLDSADQDNSMTIKKSGVSKQGDDLVTRLGSSFKNVFKDLF
ncbi:MAG: cell division protein FtsA [Proteobacteria bacterium]|jgi:cell division protein FtsA|nr:cell division protein FtsA [Pseudomonadota bacterium]